MLNPPTKFHINQFDRFCTILLKVQTNKHPTPKTLPVVKISLNAELPICANSQTFQLVPSTNIQYNYINKWVKTKKFDWKNLNLIVKKKLQYYGCLPYELLHGPGSKVSFQVAGETHNDSWGKSWVIDQWMRKVLPDWLRTEGIQ